MGVESPLVSVLMTSFNRENYIAKAIESVLASTYKNFELIIVDDQSQDRTVEIANSYASKDNRVKVYINDQNLGDYSNRNKAAFYAKGKYLKYVDADDIIYPFGLEQLVYYMEQFPEAGFGLCSLKQDKDKVYPYELNPHEAYEYHYFGPGLFHKAPLSAIIKKTAFNKVGGFTGKQHVGDFELWHILSRYFPVVLMPQGIVWYREHEDQQMADNRTNPLVPFKYLVLAENLIRDEDCPLDKAVKSIVIRKIQIQKIQSILFSIKRFDLLKAKQMIFFKLTNL